MSTADATEAPQTRVEAQHRPTRARIGDPRFAIASFLAATLIFFGGLVAFVLTTSPAAPQPSDEAFIQYASGMRSDLGALLAAVARGAPMEEKNRRADVIARKLPRLLALQRRIDRSSVILIRSVDYDGLAARLNGLRSGVRRGDDDAVRESTDAAWLSFDGTFEAIRAHRIRAIGAAENEENRRRHITALLIAGCMAAALALGFGAARQWSSLKRHRAALEATVRERTAEANDARMRAESENRAKSEFLLRMSHELRTPLNAVIGFSDFMRASDASTSAEKLVEYADDIHGAGLHLQGLVDDLLALGRLDVGALTIAFESVSFNDVAARAVTLAGAAADARIRITPSALTLRVDRRATLQILINLIANARRYAKDATRIEMSCVAGAAPDRAAIVVRDDGPGMADDALRRALAPLDALGDPFVAQRGGAQVGLSIVRRLARSQGGDVRFVTAPGEGFCAEIDVGLAADAGRSVAA